MRTALLAALLTSCTVPYYEMDEEILGVQFDWQGQQDREPADDLLCHCAQILGDGRHLYGARVRFTDDASRDCGLDFDAAGCWSVALNDLIVLETAEHLTDTPLCHELAHRARYYAHGQMPGAEDPNHCDAELWGALNVQPTGPCP